MIKNIIFDFDGVILDSVPVKTEGFKQLFSSYDNNLVDKLLKYHEINGGMSRYKKIEYFFNELLDENVSYEDILKLGNKYSMLTKNELSNSKYLILDTFNYIKENYQKYNFHIASGADENDLKYICKKLELDKYFLSIHGSPMIKDLLVKNILKDNLYSSSETIMIGDSINDYVAANVNNIDFYAFNNESLIDKFKYISKFKDFICK